jgi:CelD/BcsL family acetyltransferase involved in cellulose biosynthesis
MGPGVGARSTHEIDPLSDSRWESLVQSHPKASVFHGTKWLRALQTTYGYDPIVVTICSPGAALTNGIVFCRVERWLTGRRFVSVPFADHCEPLVSNLADMDNLLLHMKQYVDSGKWRYIEIRPITRRPGSRSGLSTSTSYSFHCLDLSKNVNELFNSFHKDCVQRKIRRAEREKLHYEEGTSEALIQTFYELLLITRRRQCLPLQPISWFRGLIAAFGQDLKIRVATKDNKPAASILTLTHKNSMVYKYGCSDARFHRCGGVPFLLWNAIQEAKAKGYEYFDMGRSDKANSGLISFKKRWGATGAELSYWTYPRRPMDKLSERQKAILRRLVPLAPAFALKTVGSFFYGQAG